MAKTVHAWPTDGLLLLTANRHDMSLSGIKLSLKVPTLHETWWALTWRHGDTLDEYHDPGWGVCSETQREVSRGGDPDPWGKVQEEEYFSIHGLAPLPCAEHDTWRRAQAVEVRSWERYSRKEALALRAKAYCRSSLDCPGVLCICAGKEKVRPYMSVDTVLCI